MKTLKVSRSEGSVIQAVELKADPKSPEPETFRVRIPGAVVDVTRCTDASFWVHVTLENPLHDASGPGSVSRFTAARLDIASKHASESNLGDFAHPDLYHVAVHVQPKPTLCPNCNQWQHPAGDGTVDCFNQCIERGLAPRR